MSQGYIGFHIQNALYNMMLTKKSSQTDISTSGITSISRMKKDSAFNTEQNRIGSFYSEDEKAKRIRKNKAKDMSMVKIERISSCDC